MDWENKFKSIVDETEANLAKVKKRLSVTGSKFRGDSSADSWSLAKFSPLTRRPLSAPVKHGPGSSTPKILSQNGHVSFHSPIQSQQNSFDMADFSSYPTGITVHDRLDEQKKTIQQLTQLVQRLESERDHSRQHMADLRNEVNQLSCQLLERGTDNRTDRKVETWKRDIMTELELLRSQLRVFNSKDSGADHLSESQIIRFSRELLELRRLIKEETDLMRRDMEVIKTRLLKVELDVSSGSTGRRDLEKKHHKLNQTVQYLSDSRSSRDVSKSFQRDKAMDKIELSDLRSSVTGINSKLDVLENYFHTNGSLNTSKLDKDRMSRVRHGDERSRDRVRLSDEEDDSDVDLAEYISSDYPYTAKPTPARDVDSIIEDDLDLDDLDLSDDDDLSDDI